MEDRQIIEWDKDDIDALRFMKVDVLALGMLTCMAKGLALIEAHKGVSYDLATIPPEDPRTYAMIRKADTLGTFQIESRAQMAMLPRIKPRTFYDLVIEVAIVRPGPIQGGMVQPYIRRRMGLEEVSYPSPELKEVLGKTLGVPLFQEQAMQIAVVAAGFTPAEADRWSATAGELLTEKADLFPGSVPTLVTAAPTTSVADAVATMNRYGVDALPVILEPRHDLRIGEVRGTVSSAALADALAEGRATAQTPVADVMGPVLPCLGARTPLRAVARRLAQDPVLLVLEAGRVQGVVTLHDVLAHVTA